jgi:RimJ/RimL family protein N-acetyltransferase
MSLFNKPHVIEALNGPDSIAAFERILAVAGLENLIILKGTERFGTIVLERAPDWLLTLRVLAVWEPGQGAGRFAMRYLLKRAFLDYKVHRVFLEVVESNSRARSLYESFGFRLEGVYREGYRDKAGMYHNLAAYGILSNDYEAALAPGRARKTRSGSRL